jgi:hypothetical protein
MVCTWVLSLSDAWCCSAGYPAAEEFLKDWQVGISIDGTRRTLPMCTLEDVHRDTWRGLGKVNTFVTRHKAIVFAIYREYYGHPLTSAADPNGDGGRPALNDWAAACMAIDLRAANMSKAAQFTSDEAKALKGSPKAFSCLADALKKEWTAGEYERRYGALLGLTHGQWGRRNRLGEQSNERSKRRRMGAAVSSTTSDP